MRTALVRRDRSSRRSPRGQKRCRLRFPPRRLRFGREKSTRPDRKLLHGRPANRSGHRQEPSARKNNRGHESDFRRSIISRPPRSISELAHERREEFVPSPADRSQSSHRGDRRFLTRACVRQIVAGIGRKSCPRLKSASPRCRIVRY